MPQYDELIVRGVYNGDVDDINKGYEKCVIALMKEAFLTQKSLLSAAERRKYGAAYKRYIAHAEINPHTVFNAPLGGKYNAVYRPSAIPA